MSIHVGTDSYIVVIEWDGEKPPTRWYDRLRVLAGKDKTQNAVRGSGDKETSASVRRTGEEQSQGIVIQEGTIICPSRSLAETIACYAKGEFSDWMIAKGRKPPEVYFGGVTLDPNWQASPTNQQDVDRIQSLLSRRGKKPEAKSWVVSCLECLNSTSIVVPYVINCPNCSSVRYFSRKGVCDTWLDDKSVDVIEMWQRTRFAHTHAEFGEITTLTSAAVGAVSPPSITVSEPRLEEERKAVQAIVDSNLPTILRKMPRNEAFTVLDAITVSRAHCKKSLRQNERTKTVTDYFSETLKTPKNMPMVNLVELVPDLLDAGMLLGRRTAVAYAIEYMGEHTNES